MPHTTQARMKSSNSRRLKWVSVLATVLTSTVAFAPLAPVSTRHTTIAAGIATTTTTTSLPASSLDEDLQTTTDKKKKSPRNLAEQFQSSSMVSAAAMATAAVNAAVGMRTLEAADTKKSYIARNIDNVTIDEEGLPLTYDKAAIEQYWSKERGALNKRWGQFVGKTVPFLTRLTTLFIRDGSIKDQYIPELSRQARLDLQALGPTFIKAGQMMSVRPDVLPQSTLDELQKLQDSVEPFDTPTAIAQIERELGGPLNAFFSSISEEPIAAASLAQVYKATLNDEQQTEVAIKVQRPDVLGTVSKDLYVLRRAAEVFDGLIKRFAPQQKTDYVALLNEWSIGFYTELDFANEAENQRLLRQVLLDKNITSVSVPKVYNDLCTRRILVSEWVDGKKLSECDPSKIKQVTEYAQEAFLTQLFEVGFFHADPHPGNLLVPNDPNYPSKLVLIDCGLMASIEETDRDNMISAVIHLANKNYAALVDDFVKLKILPADSNRATIIPLMDKALTPYVKGGGAKKYEAELMKLYGMDDTMQSKVGGFQAMTQDALTVLQDVPFSIPPYFAILGRAIVTLEGVALSGNPDYGIIMEAYPFIARKLLREGRPEIQKALYEVLYSSDSSDSGSLKLTRLLALLNNAAGSVSTQEGAAFVDLDTVPEDGLSIADSLKFVLSDSAGSLRTLLETEVDNAVDLLSRQIFRRAISEASVALTPPRPRALPLIGDIFPPTPSFDEIPLPILLPPFSRGGRPTVTVMSLKEFTDIAAPKLDQEEELFAIGLADGAREFLGDDVGDLLKGERVLSAQSVQLVLKALRSGALGQSNLANNSDAARAVQQFAQQALNLSGSSSSNSDGELFEAVNKLSPVERERLDEIFTELSQRAIQRAIDRLSKVEGLL